MKPWSFYCVVYCSNHFHQRVDTFEELLPVVWITTVTWLQFVRDNISPHLLVTPAQLVWPGSGRMQSAQWMTLTNIYRPGRCGSLIFHALQLEYSYILWICQCHYQSRMVSQHFHVCSGAKKSLCVHLSVSLSVTDGFTTFSCM